MQTNNTVVVIPCYNEANRIDECKFFEFIDACSNVTLLMVNDGSTDATLARLKEMEQHPSGRLCVLDLPRNVGKAEAVRSGVLQARKMNPTYIAFWDADLATPLTMIPRFQEVLDRQSDLFLVIGSRVALLGRRIQRRWYRHAMGRTFATFASWVLGLPVYDTQCGAKMFRVTPEVTTVFRFPFRSRWIFDVEILARLTSHSDGEDTLSARQRIYELPLEEWHDVKGSKLKARDFARAAGELFVIHRDYRWRTWSGLNSTAKGTERILNLPGDRHVDPTSKNQRRPAA